MIKHDDMVIFSGGGKSAPEQQPMIAPTAPVEEASVEIDDEQDSKLKTSKSSLKIPLAETVNTGLKV